MELSNYAKVGRAKLLCLIGLQENFKQEVQVLDVEASGCISCPFHPVNQYIDSPGSEIISKCNNCPHVVFKTKTVYTNEKNQFARDTDSHNMIPDSPVRLKSGAILLYMAIHFCKINTSNGVAYNVSIKELSELLSCNRKTIRNNLAILDKYGYIHSIPVDQDYVTVVIQNFKNNFSNASQGGRGYFLITKELFQQILKLRNINDLRLCLRFLDLTIQEERFGSKHARIRVSYEDARRWLPYYAKPHIIRRSLEHLTPVFNEIHTGGSAIAVTLSPEYQSSRQLEKSKHEAYINISDYVKQVRDTLDSFNQSRDISDPRLERLGIRLPVYRVNDELQFEYDSYQSFYLNHEQRENMANLAIEYTEQEVIQALAIYFNEYVQPHVEIRASLGALIRTIIRNEQDYYRGLTPLSKLA